MKGLTSLQVACSRDGAGCLRCERESVVCTYSRSGIIRRDRKRKHSNAVADQPIAASVNRYHDSKPTNDSVQSNLATDIDVTRERLRALDETPIKSLGALSSLAEACAAVWHDAYELDMMRDKVFLFDNQAVSWADGNFVMCPFKAITDTAWDSIRRCIESRSSLLHHHTSRSIG